MAARAHGFNCGRVAGVLLERAGRPTPPSPRIKSGVTKRMAFPSPAILFYSKAMTDPTPPSPSAAPTVSPRMA
ncbi:hypothetical protein MOP88_05360 [Sphingomonas sp. WKB10]|nr:hypothetical protein [Sphingomonas sp. WKB10]